MLARFSLIVVVLVCLLGLFSKQGFAQPEGPSCGCAGWEVTNLVEDPLADCANAKYKFTCNLFDCGGGLVEAKGMTVGGDGIGDAAVKAESKCGNYFKSKGSIIDNDTLNYIHDVKEYPLGGASGCGSCGASSQSSGIAALSLGRYHRSRDQTQGSSFGPGVFMNYDIRLRFYDGDTTRRIVYFSPESSQTQDFVETRVSGQDWTGVLSYEGTEAATITLYDSAGDVTTGDFADAATAVYDTHQGGKVHFQVFDSATVAPIWMNDVHRNEILRLAGNHYMRADSAYKGVSGSGARTTSAWVRTVASGTVVHWGQGSGAGKMWEMTVANSGAIRVQVGWGGLEGTTSVSDGAWHHIAAVLPDGATNLNQAKLYVDGVPDAIASASNRTINTVLHWQIRVGSYYYDRRFDGDLDDVRIYSRALSATEILDLAQDNPVAPTSLEGHWKLNESSGTIAADSSGNGRDLLIFNVNPELAGRAVKIEQANGYATTLSYIHPPSGNLDVNTKRWQLESITDASSRTATFEYAPNQVGGQWVVSKMTLPNTHSIDYTYGPVQLESVSYPDGTTATIGVEIDPVSSLVKYTYRDAGATGAKRNKQVYLSSGIFVFSTEKEKASKVYNQAALLVRMVETPDEELTYANRTQSDSQRRYLYEGGGKVSNQMAGFSREFYTTWEVDTNAASFEDGFTGTVEPTFARQRGSWAQLTNGLPAQFQRATGEMLDLEYDAVGNITKQSYSDGTFIELERDITAQGDVQLYQVTRSRDRLGRVTRSTYDARGNMLTKEVGILEVNGVDLEQAEYAKTTYEYYPAGDDNEYLLKTAFEANYDPATPDLFRTDYEYDTDHFLTKVISAADFPGQTRPEKTYTYDTARRLASSTDAMGRKTLYTYDTRDRQVKATYNDQSTEETFYGTGDNANLVVARKDRNDHFSQMRYDSYGRNVMTIGGIDNQVDALDQTFTPDATFHTVRTCNYIDGTSLRSSCTTNGETTEYEYDYRHRLVKTTIHPRNGISLSTSNEYVENKLFRSTDAYGRNSYRAYRDSDSALIRTIQGLVPSFQLADYDAVMDQVRPTDRNAANQTSTIADAIQDVAGQTIATINARGIVNAMVYDSRGRSTLSIEAATTLPPYDASTFDPTDDSQLETLAAKTATIYDANSNVVEVRHPRWFDSSDTFGFGKCSSKSTFTGRNLTATSTVAAGAPNYTTGNLRNVRVSMSYDYYPDGRQNSVTDFRGNTSSQLWHQCCGRSQGSIDAAGHGSLSNTDFYGNVTHTAYVDNLQGDVTTNGNGLEVVATAHNPNDDRTLMESTTRYDSRNRMIARTTWLDPLGEVDPNAVPIAGGGEAGDPDAHDGNGDPVGLTTRMFYDEDLTDGVGLDAGQSVPRLAGNGNLTIDISSLLVELSADGVTIGSESNFYATASVNPEDEISVSISDGTGRGVASGRYAADGTLVTWNSVLHDTVVDVAGYGDVLETASIDALNHITKSRSDAAGRTMESEDAAGKVATASYDSNSNVLSSRDANGVGQDCVYDLRNRRTTCTDTQGDTTSVDYDQNSNVILTTDAKGQLTTVRFDSRNRRITVDDRLTGSRTFTLYDQNSNVTFIRDPDQQRGVGVLRLPGSTLYTYDERNLKISCTFPDHDASPDEDSDSDEKRYEYDALSRTILMTDQNGDTQTHGYDMASRLLRKDYRTAANSPDGDDIADSDVFTYDDASRRLTATSGRYNNVCSMEYDDAGRVISDSLTTNGATFVTINDYDDANRLTKQTYPDGSVVDRRYTNRNQLEQIDWDGSQDLSNVHTRTYDDGMRLIGTTHGIQANQVVSTLGYRNDNLLANIDTPASTAAANGVGNYSYDYDPNKNKTRETITGPLADYGFGGNDGSDTVYDAEDRLTTWNRNDGNLDRTWKLSFVGRWNSLTEVDEGETRIQALTHTRGHEITSFDGAPVSHDAKGNRTLDQLGRTMAWDFDNRLSSATVPAGSPKGEVGTHNYAYDALGRRVSKTTGGELTIFACSGSQVVGEYRIAAGATPNPASPDQRYVYGSYVDEVILKEGTFSDGTSSGIVYYHRNQQYSIVALTDTAGAVVERYAYTAYGDITTFDGGGTEIASTAYANPYTYTARRFDEELGLMYFRARYYDPQTGEFISRDPLGYVDGMSLYRGYFVPGGVDPSGAFLVTAEASIGWRNRPFRNTEIKPWLSVKPRESGCRLDEPTAETTLETGFFGPTVEILKESGPTKFFRSAKAGCCCEGNKLECVRYYVHATRVHGVGISVDGTGGKIPGVSLSVSGYIIHQQIDHYFILAACSDGSWSVEILSIDVTENPKKNIYYHNHNGHQMTNWKPRGDGNPYLSSNSESRHYWSKRRSKGGCLDETEITGRIENPTFTAPSTPLTPVK